MNIDDSNIETDTSALGETQVQDNKNILYLGAGVMAGVLLALMFKKS